MITKQQYSCKKTILQNRCTIPSSDKPTTMRSSLITKTNQEIEAQCSLSIFYTPPAFPPIIITITSNLWILILTPATQGLVVTMICPDKTSSTLFQQPFHILKLPPACNAIPRHFHLPPHYDDHVVMMHIPLDRANLNANIISTPDFCTWQHFNSNCTTTHMQKLVGVPKVSIPQLYNI